MKKYRKHLIFLIAVSAIIVGGWRYCLWTRGPIYMGRSMSYWLQYEWPDKYTGRSSRGLMYQKALAANPDAGLDWLLRRVEDARTDRSESPKWKFWKRSRSSNHYNERLAAMVAIHEISVPSPRAVPTLLRLLNDPKEGDVIQPYYFYRVAANTLTSYRPWTYPALLERFQNGSVRQRGLIIEALYPRSIEEPWKTYAGEPPRVAVPRPLPTEGEFALVTQILRKGLQDPDRSTRTTAFDCLKHWWAEEFKSAALDAAIPAMCQLLEDPEQERDYILETIFDLRSESSEIIPQLMEVARKPATKHRGAIVGMLGREAINVQDYRPFFEEMTRSSDTACRYHAVIALARLGVKSDPVNEELLQKLQSDPDYQARGDAFNTLIRLGPVTVELLPAILDAIEKAEVGYPLESLFDSCPGLTPALVKCITHVNPYVRVGAAEALAARHFDPVVIEDETVEQALKKASAEDTDSNVRNTAASALQRILQGRAAYRGEPR